MSEIDLNKLDMILKSENPNCSVIRKFPSKIVLKDAENNLAYFYDGKYNFLEQCKLYLPKYGEYTKQYYKLIGKYKIPSLNFNYNKTLKDFILSNSKKFYVMNSANKVKLSKE